MNRINRLRAKRLSGKGEIVEGDSGQVIDMAAQIVNPASDRMPNEVWALVQGSGVEAAHRLSEMLQPTKFNALAAKDKMRLIELAMSRAYGRPDAGVKRSVQVQLSASGNDAVAASLARLNKAADLPEYSTQTPFSGDLSGVEDD